MSLFEIVAAAFGIVSVYLSTRQNVLSWPTSLVNVTMYFVYFLNQKLYALMVLQVFFGVISLYGWYKWMFGGKAKTELKVTRTPPRQAVFLTVAGAVAFAAIWYALDRFTQDPSPALDSFFFAVSLIGQYMMARKYFECWPVWVAINCISVPFFFFQHAYPTMVQYAVFLILATQGWRYWKASLVASS
jgi:nicotinamide mononucleotide transporter